MTINLDNETVTLVNVDMNDFDVKISYIDSSGNLKVKQKKVDWSRQLTIATGVIL